MKLIIALALFLPTLSFSMVASAPKEVYEAALAQMQDSEAQVSLEFKQDVVDEAGKIIIAKGTVLKTKESHLEIKRTYRTKTK